MLKAIGKLIDRIRYPMREITIKDATVFFSKPDGVAQAAQDEERILKAVQEFEGESGLRFYGDGGTYHRTDYIDVETHDGEVVAVWFRCSILPARQVEVSEERANAVRGSEPGGLMAGVVFRND